MTYDSLNYSTAIIVGATVLNLYFVYLNYLIKTPVIDIKLESLPPYENKTDKTVLRLKNVGTKGTKSDFETILSCSWIPSMSMKFNLPSEGHRLDPNEEIIWRFRLDENFPPTSTIHVTVNEGKFGLTWELTEQL
jgi:hypothetical protein